MVCQDANFIINNIAYYKNAVTGMASTSDADWKRRGLYLGPQVSCFSLRRLHP